MDVASALRAVADGWCALARGILRAARALDNHWIGDLIGVVSLFGILYVALVAGWVLQ